MNTWIYLQMEVIPVLALLIILYNVRHQRSAHRSMIRYQNLIILVIVIMLLDAANWYIQLETEHQPWVTYVVNIIYYILTEMISYFWFVIVFNRVNRGIKTNKIRRIEQCAAAIAMLTLIVISLSPFFHTIFYVDEQGMFRRGSFYFVQVLCGFGLMFAASIIAYIRSMNIELQDEKEEYRFLAYLALIPFIGGTLQIIDDSLVLLWQFTAVAVFLIYIDAQKHQISIDSLTELNNRASLERFVYQKIKMANHDWYIIMIDVDKFKSINDIYGHMEGDKALRIISDALKKSFGPYKTFIARYGGDEFVVIGDFENDSEIDSIIEKVRRSIRYILEENETEYEINFSYGWEKSTSGSSLSVSEIMNIADTKMYIQKAGHNTKEKSVKNI